MPSAPSGTAAPQDRSFNPAPASLLADLRAHTRPLHDRLETHLAVFERMRTHDSYAALLQRFWGLYVPLEAALDVTDTHRALPVDWASRRRKVARLESDLASLGSARDNVPVCPYPPDVSTPARALGCLYVLEGATLGGQVIARFATSGKVPPSVAEAHAFFSGYGASNGAQWRAFTLALEEWAARATPVEREEAVESAAHTFEVFARWMSVLPACPPPIEEEESLDV